MTFVHVRRLARPRSSEWEPEEALHEVARRYATAYGPVGIRQLREWLAAKVDVDVPDVTSRPPVPRRLPVRLLPEYDST